MVISFTDSITIGSKRGELLSADIFRPSFGRDGKAIIAYDVGQKDFFTYKSNGLEFTDGQIQNLSKQLLLRADTVFKVT